MSEQTKLCKNNFGVMFEIAETNTFSEMLEAKLVSMEIPGSVKMIHATMFVEKVY